MKKTVAILLVAVMVLTLLAACSAKDKLIGTWEREENGVKMTFEFKKNGKLIVKGYYNGEEMMSQEKEYKVEGNKIIVDGDPEPFKIEGKTLTIGEGNDVMTFTKK